MQVSHLLNIQQSMSEACQNKKAMTSKIYYLRQRSKIASIPQLSQTQPLAIAHISSALQSKHRKSLNKQLKVHCQKINDSDFRFNPFLTERPQSTRQFRDVKDEVKRQKRTSQQKRAKKGQDPSAFYLSDIAEEAWSDNSMRQLKKDSKIDGYELDRLKSRKQNYLMRKGQFKTFLRDQEDKIKMPLSEEVREVVYQKQEANKWGAELALQPCNSFLVNPSRQRRLRYTHQRQSRQRGRLFSV